MRSTDLTVRNPSGIHARPAALFVRTVAGFRATVTLENLDRGTAPVNARSMIEVMKSGVSRGHRIRITADGADEDAAIEALEAFVAGGLGETIAD